SQKVVPDAAHAYAAMLRAGADSFTDNGTDPTESVEAIAAAPAQGPIETSHVDRAVVRRLVARARTGEFDGQPGLTADPGSSTEAGSDVPARPAPPLPAAATPVTRQERRALSRELATRAAVLLARADGAALPLRTG